jgi:hypothetical protein
LCRLPIGEAAYDPQEASPLAEQGTATPISDAVAFFIDHIRVHSPGKPETVRRYQKVMEHIERHLRDCLYVEAITRAHIDDFKTKRSKETSQQHDRIITPRTINFEVRACKCYSFTGPKRAAHLFLFSYQ